MEFPLLSMLQRRLAGDDTVDPEATIQFPPTVARLLGVKLTAIASGTATMTMAVDPKLHANPMGTIHGGILCDLADATIGTAHATTLRGGESFTTVDLQIKFFRPVWQDTLQAVARPGHQGRTVSYYTCDVTRGDGKLVAVVNSTVMTLSGDAAKGR